jgi:uncharacterized protein YkwD
MRIPGGQVAGALLALTLLAACTTTAAQGTIEPVATERLRPTYTPLPTYTPAPTYTPVPTYTPMPTYTAPPALTRAQPSPTPSPTATSTSRPTRTPSPTYTPTSPTPSPSPSPSPTAAPTHTSLPTQLPTESGAIRLSALEQATVDAVNRERQSRGLDPLQVDPVLTELARGHAQDMIDRNYFSHTTPEGKTYKMRLRERGIVLNWTGENFYATSAPEDEVVDVTMRWLMGDPTHRRNILNENYKRIGVGIAKSATGLHIAVQDFTE